jgi:hypothetical protein
MREEDKRHEEGHRKENEILTLTKHGDGRKFASNRENRLAVPD